MQKDHLDYKDYIHRVINTDTVFTISNNGFLENVGSNRCLQIAMSQGNLNAMRKHLLDPKSKFPMKDIQEDKISDLLNQVHREWANQYAFDNKIIVEIYAADSHGKVKLVTKITPVIAQSMLQREPVRVFSFGNHFECMVDPNIPNAKKTVLQPMFPQSCINRTNIPQDVLSSTACEKMVKDIELAFDVQDPDILRALEDSKKLADEIEQRQLPQQQAMQQKQFPQQQTMHQKQFPQQQTMQQRQQQAMQQMQPQQQQTMQQRQLQQLLSQQQTMQQRPQQQAMQQKQLPQQQAIQQRQLPQQQQAIQQRQLPQQHQAMQQMQQQIQQQQQAMQQMQSQQQQAMQQMQQMQQQMQQMQQQQKTTMQQRQQLPQQQAMQQRQLLPQQQAMQQRQSQQQMQQRRQPLPPQQQQAAMPQKQREHIQKKYEWEKQYAKRRSEANDAQLAKVLELEFEKDAQRFNEDNKLAITLASQYQKDAEQLLDDGELAIKLASEE